MLLKEGYILHGQHTPASFKLKMRVNAKFCNIQQQLFMSYYFRNKSQLKKTACKHRHCICHVLTSLLLRVTRAPTHDVYGKVQEAPPNWPHYPVDPKFVDRDPGINWSLEARDMPRVTRH